MTLPSPPTAPIYSNFSQEQLAAKPAARQSRAKQRATGYGMSTNSFTLVTRKETKSKTQMKQTHCGLANGSGRQGSFQSLPAQAKVFPSVRHLEGSAPY